jgi:serine/threonine protein kinase/WD40 repeat protein
MPLTQLGPFRIVAKIGQGGMGDVYQGRDDRLRRPVAIKVLPSELARHEDFVRRFLAEATALARVVHPNVVRIHFIGEDEGRHFFAMQYVDGESLAQRLTRLGRLACEEATSIVEQCLGGLGAAHSRGLIHRDVKPGNILIDGRTGRVVLVDFGLVRRIDGSTRMTATGTIMGTVDYIAPEQVRGKDLDGRSDLYSLGVIFYQMLSGRLPFEAATPTAMMFQHAYGQPLPLPKAARDVPEPICHIVARLMARDPAERYTDCAEALDDVCAFRQQRPLKSAAADVGTPKSDPSPLPEPLELPEGLARLASKRLGHRIRDWLATVFRRHAPELIEQLQSTTQQVDAVIDRYERHRDRLARSRQEGAGIALELSEAVRAALEGTASEGRTTGPASEMALQPDNLTQERAGRRDLTALQAQYDAQQEQIDRIDLELHKLDATLARLRSQRDVLKARLAGARARGATVDGRSTWSRHWRLTLAGVIVAVVIGAVCWALLATRDRDPAVATSPPSVPAPDAVRPAGVDAVPPGEIRTIRCPVGCVRSLAVTPDGRRLLGGTSQGFLCVWDVATGQELFRAQPEARPKEVLNATPRIAVSPTASHLAWCGRGGSIHIWDLNSLRETCRIETPLGRLTGVAFGPGGDRVLAGGGSYWTGSHEAPLRMWDRRDGQEILLLDDPQELIDAVAMAPDGRRVLSAVADHTIRLYDASDGRQTMTLEGHSRRVASVKFVPGGASALSGSHDTSVRLWDLASGEQKRRLAGHTDRVYDVAVSADGRHALSCAGDGTVRLWDLDSGREICVLEGHTEGVRCVAFLPEDRTAVSGGDDGTIRLWRLPISGTRRP